MIAPVDLPSNTMTSSLQLPITNLAFADLETHAPNLVAQQHFCRKAICRIIFLLCYLQPASNHATISKGEVGVSIKRRSACSQRLHATTVTTVKLDEVEPSCDASQSTLCQQSSYPWSNIAPEVSACTGEALSSSVPRRSSGQPHCRRGGPGSSIHLQHWRARSHI